MYDIEKCNKLDRIGSRNLYSYHKIDDKLYEFMLVDQDTKLAIRPYNGPLGTFKVGKGGRELEKVEFSGSLINEDSRTVPVRAMKEHWPDALTECSIPVGDYTPSMICVTYDNLLFNISKNYYTNAQGYSSHKSTVYDIHVRQDKLYVLDFSNEPMVIFYELYMGQTTFSRGQEITFASVLIDPKLDIMIRGLDDTSVKVDQEIKDRKGNVVKTITVNKSLDPNVVIARANGEVVAKGVMPFS